MTKSPYSIKISRQTIVNIIKRLVEKSLEFEVKMKHKLESRGWQIDDTPEIFPRSEKGDSNTEGKKNQDLFGLRMSWLWIHVIGFLQTYLATA